MTDSPSSAKPHTSGTPHALGTSRASSDEPAPDTGHAPDSEPSGEEGRFVLPLVVRIERAAPPPRTDAMETAARAVLTFLADPRTAEETGAWHKRVRLWEERGIRKVVRRARGSEWRRTEPLEHLTVTGRTDADRTPADGTDADTAADDTAAVRTTEVRVFPPVPLDGWPGELSRLQVSGTHLEDPRPPPAPEAGAPVLWLNPALEMTAGKAMAQAAHGAQLAWWELSEPDRASWRDAGFPLAVRAAHGAEHWQSLTASGLPVVRDAGFTEIAPGATVVAEGGNRFCPLPRARRP